MKIEPRNTANLTLKQLFRLWLMSSLSYIIWGKLVIIVLIILLPVTSFSNIVTDRIFCAVSILGRQYGHFSGTFLTYLHVKEGAHPTNLPLQIPFVLSLKSLSTPGLC